MASEKQKAANRRNAQASTGPRSRSGKARSSQNALNHGLAAACASTASIPEDVIGLTRAIAGPDCGEIAVLTYASAIADAEVHLRRIQAMRTRLMVRLAEEIQTLSSSSAGGAGQSTQANREQQQQGTVPNSGHENDGESSRQTGVSRTLGDITPLERYETRARSRRKKAIRNLAELKMEIARDGRAG